MTTNQSQHRSSTVTGWAKWAWAGLELLLAYIVVLNASWWWLVMLGVVAIELRGSLREGWKDLAARALGLVPELLTMLSLVLTIAVLPRRASQLALLAGVAVWLIWRARAKAGATTTYVYLLLVQAIMFEAIFLTAAIWQVPAVLTLILVWLGAYFSVYSVLKRRDDRTAGVVAATWAVIATEVSWVLLLWLVTYVLQQDGFVMVPQPALILTALAYVFGSILLASRQGTLSRSRLAEYLIIGFILVLIVVVETLWRHAA